MWDDDAIRGYLGGVMDSIFSIPVEKSGTGTASWSIPNDPASFDPATIPMEMGQWRGVRFIETFPERPEHAR